jgi:ABC-2 type transport system ATP-binding protein
VPVTPRGLSLRDVCKRYGTRAVLDGASLDVSPGEVVGLIGPNGGGKSTLLLVMAGLVRPDSGTASLDGTPAHRVALDHSGSVGLITATPGLYPLLTGWENLLVFGALYGLDAAETRRRVAPLAERLAIGELLDQRVAAGSSGMQQKISLLRALLMDPAALLLDEPTSNLDPFAASAIHETARAHADRGRAVVWVTHDLPAAEAVCDRVALVRQRIHHVEAFTGPRTAPAAGLLMQRWRTALGAP